LLVSLLKRSVLLHENGFVWENRKLKI